MVQPIANSRRKVGLALGGGAARCIAHIGAIKALEYHNIPIDYIAGTSAGALVGVFYAAGIDIETIAMRVKELKWSDFATFQLSRLGMMTPKPIEILVQEYLGDATFKDMKIPFASVATDLITGTKKVFKDPDRIIAPTIRASASFPGILEPTMIDGIPYCDGGASENVPVASVKELGADIVIAIDVIPFVTLSRTPSHMMAVVDRALDILLINEAKAQLDQADIVLRPLTEYFASRHFKHASRMIELGMESVEKQIDHIRKVTQS